MIRLAVAALLVGAGLAGCTTLIGTSPTMTGPQELTFSNPPEGSTHLMVTFWCSQGDYRVEMREDTDVYMSGPCGGSTYEMPLPTGVDAVTLSVTVADDAEFELSGDWS